MIKRVLLGALAIFAVGFILYGAPPSCAQTLNNSILDKGKDMPVSDGIYQALTQTPEWLNTARPLTPDDLKGRVILIDFWTYCCINCIHVIPKLQQLEHEFGKDLTVIGIHSAKFTTEGETDNIREAIQKYGIEHPVINDADFRVWNSFGARAWPTLALIGADGLLKQVYRGEGDIDAMRSDIRKAIAQAGKNLVTQPLPMALEKDKIPPTVLQFPTKLTPFDAQHIVISDSGHQRILVADVVTGRITHQIGSGEKGYRDGALDVAQFNDPQGVLVDGNQIYVADTGNHRLRLIDLDTQRVTTLAGIGERGSYVLLGAHNARKTALASPWDLAFYPDRKTIVIANAGTHQLWAYDRADETVRILAGNGQESIDDGHLPFNSLSQPSGLSVGGKGLYLVDSETSALRIFDDGDLQTLIGTGLFDFGLKDGDRASALMQHAVGLYADGDAVYIVDTYNHVLRLYKQGRLTTLPLDGLKEPNGITRIGDVFYVADTNNHRIIRMTDSGDMIDVLNIMPAEKEPDAITWQDSMPNAVMYDLQTVTRDAAIKIDLPQGWKINEAAPSYMALFDADHKAVQGFMRDALQSGDAVLDVPVGRYAYQGIIYYCEKKEGAQCLIRGVQGEIEVKDKGTHSIILPIKP